MDRQKDYVSKTLKTSPRKERAIELEENFVVDQWQPTSTHTGAIRSFRPDITPVPNPKLYKFRDSEPASKGWGLASGDALTHGNKHIDAVPVGNPRFHAFRDAEPTSKGWGLSGGDMLDTNKNAKLDTTPLGMNPRMYKFRDNGSRAYKTVPKTQRPLVAYFEG